MDDCCAPQWADFTASPRLPSDSYFEVEHEVHQSRNRTPSDKFEDSLQNTHEDTLLNTDTEVKVKNNKSNVQNNEVNMSFFIPMENQKGSKRIRKFPGIPYKEVQNVRIGNVPQAEKNRLSDQAAAARRRTNTLGRRASHGKTQAKVLTCQYVRRSLTKNRRRSNQYVSLAEAMNKFQSETPQRFRTMSKKNLKPMPPVKMKQKLTYPVSPALRCRYRTRITANPAGTSVTTGSVVAPKNIFKKLPTTAEEPCLNRSEKPLPTNNQTLHVKPALQLKEEQCKSKMFPASVNNLPGKKEEVSEEKDHSVIISSDCKTIPRLPPAFVARNKEFQLKREQKRKALQEMAKAKPEFHAKPVPKFVKKSVTPAPEQATAKKSIVPCPFSFDQRDKCLAKQKVERLKQLQQQDTKPHVFHANPAPSFKTVPVRSRSRENLRSKEQEKSMIRQTKSCIGQENRVPNIINIAIPACAKKTEVKSGARKGVQENQAETHHKKPVIKSEVPPVLLNTDKRAKERCEFDEKIRKKKELEELERQEREKDKLSKEKQEQTELRKLTETRARPMPIFKPPIILKSSKPLTSPKSPAWANKTKLMKHAS